MSKKETVAQKMAEIRRRQETVASVETNNTSNLCPQFGPLPSTAKKKLTIADIKKQHAGIISSRQAVVTEAKPNVDEPAKSKRGGAENNAGDDLQPASILPDASINISQEICQLARLFDANVSMTSAASIRKQGFQPESTPEVVVSEYYNADRFFPTTHKFSNILPSSLIASFNALSQSLFCGSAQSTSNASLVGSKHVRKQILLEVRSENCLTSVDKRSIQHSPVDIRTVYKIFDNLDPQVTIYATCPNTSCCSIYPPILSENGVPQYPAQCTAEKYGSTCNTILVDANKTVNSMSIPKPIKPYTYHHFNDHVASMLSRPGIEDAIENHMKTSSFHTEIRDIISSQALREFHDSSGQPFLRESGTELRLVWALAADWYNPNTNKATGKSISTGVIAMICLSLPPEIRYLEENIYLCGVIPGPREPSLDATNPFLTPLVHDLNASYDPGTFFSRTHKHPTGHCCYSAIIPVIADTLASKKVTGYISHSSKYFCSRCRLPRKQIHNLDCATWPPALDRLQHESYANTWKAAQSQSHQDSLATKNGVRWSALLRLPYWQPSSWSVTEGVHVLLLGVIPRHCRDLLSLNFKDLPCDDDVYDDEPPSAILMDHGQLILAQSQPSKLRKLRMDVLKALCQEKKVSVPVPRKGQRRKKDYIEALLGSAGYIKEEPGFSTDMGIRFLMDGNKSADTTDEAIPSTGSMQHPPSHDVADGIQSGVITQHTLTKIREHIKATLRPVWQTHLPEEFGSPLHGKLKADQWRTALEFDVPVSLIQILAEQKPSGLIDDEVSLQKLVSNTLDLAMALSWGLSRRTSEFHAQKYIFYMQQYLKGVRELYPHYNLKPIHHYALHIPDVLRLFGPLHGTWVFTLERLIGRLQNINTNSIIGEMESTAMTTFCRRSNLIRWVGSEDCPTVIKKSWKDFCSRQDMRDLELGLPQPKEKSSSRCCGPSPQRLDKEIQSAFLVIFTPPQASGAKLYFGCESIQVFHFYTQGSVQYADYIKSENHSLVYIRPESSTPLSKSNHRHGMGAGDSNLFPAQVRHFFRHQHLNSCGLVTENYAVVHCYVPVVLPKDPFAQFPDFRAAIFKREPSPTFSIIKASQIHCHANQRPWDNSSVVMRAIDRDY